MTLKNVPIVSGFGFITAAQFAVGIWRTVHAALGGGNALDFVDRRTILTQGAPSVVVETAPPIPFDPHRGCASVPFWALEVGLTASSLLYGTSERSALKPGTYDGAA